VHGDDQQPVDVGPTALPALRPRLAVIRKDELAVIREVDEALPQILGWSPDELVGTRPIELVHPEDLERAIASWMDLLAAPGARVAVRLRHRHRDGSWVWFDVTNENRLDDPAQRCVVAEMVDVSEEMAALETLRAQERLLRRLTEGLPLGVYQLDAERRVVYSNERLTSILGTEAATAADQLALVASADRDALDAAIGRALDGRDDDVEVTFRRPDGEERRCALSMRSLADDAGGVAGAVVCVFDITDAVRMRNELEDRATFDALTRCHNRATILAEVERALQLRPPGTGTAVIFIDLDRFKDVNDRHGHAAGDELLVAVAQRLLGAVREGDLVGRIGGDEYLVVCPRVDSAEAALTIAERLRSSVVGDVRVGDHIVHLMASVGVTWTDDDVTAVDALIAEADAAMYEAKRAGAAEPVLHGAGR